MKWCILFFYKISHGIERIKTIYLCQWSKKIVIMMKRLMVNIDMNCYENTVVSYLRELHAAAVLIDHDDVIKWKHFPRYWPFVRGIHRSPVNSPHKGQWRGALMFYLICVWINGWVNNREAGDLRRYRAHYGVTAMDAFKSIWSLPYCLTTTHQYVPPEENVCRLNVIYLDVWINFTHTCAQYL